MRLRKWQNSKLSCKFLRIRALIHELINLGNGSSIIINQEMVSWKGWPSVQRIDWKVIISSDASGQDKKKKRGERKYGNEGVEGGGGCPTFSSLSRRVREKCAFRGEPNRPSIETSSTLSPYGWNSIGSEGVGGGRELGHRFSDSEISSRINVHGRNIFLSSRIGRISGCVRFAYFLK